MARASVLGDPTRTELSILLRSEQRKRRWLSSVELLITAILITLRLLSLAEVVYISGDIAPEHVYLLSYSFLMIGSVLGPLQMLGGFESPALITLMRYQTNPMVFGRGRYRLFDVGRCGLGLTVLMTLLVPWLILYQLVGA
mgnify:CR=1 FL=1